MEAFWIFPIGLIIAIVMFLVISRLEKKGSGEPSLFDTFMNHGCAPHALILMLVISLPAMMIVL